MRNNYFGTLYLFELKKILKNKVAMITFLIMLIAAIIVGEGEISGNANAEEREQFKTIERRVIDDSLLEEVKENINEYGEWDKVDPTYENIVSWARSKGDIHNLTVDALEKDRNDSIQEAKEMSLLSPGEYEYWEKRQDNIDYPGTWYDPLYSSGITLGLCDLRIVILLFLIPMGLAAVFAAEHQNKTDSIIRASKNGDKRTYYAKVLAGMSFAIVGTAVIVASFLGYFFIRWGTYYLDLPVNYNYAYTSVSLTLKEHLWMLTKLIMTGSVLIAAFTLFLSQTLKNALAVMGVSLGVWFVNVILASTLPFKMRAAQQFIQWLPHTLIDDRIVYEYRLVKLFGRYFTAWDFAPFMYILFAIIFIAAGRFIYDRQER